MKHKVGDTFEATVRIKCVLEDEEFPYTLEVVELGEEVSYGLFDDNDLSAAFDPNYKERMRLQRIQELEEELNELKSNKES